MAIPYDIWSTLLLIAGLCTLHSWFVKDRQNYTHAITGVLATILWFTSGLAVLIGIKVDTGDIYSAGWLMWLFIGIGIIQAFLTIIEILDIINEKKNGRQTHLDHVGL